ncbi:P-loop containing nucleoside triphosphate hydrolase protein, partial [Dactylonectria macrodidyma]
AADAESEKRHPAIVLLRDIEVYDQTTPFSRFYEVVKAKRSEGFPILILATAVSNSTAEYKQRTFAMDKVWEGLCLNSSKLVNISPRRTKRSEQAIQQSIEQNMPLERWRQLRRALRHALEPEITSEVFLPQTEWPISGTAELKQTVDDWDDAMAARFIRQICTRARRTSALTLGDITEVLERTSRNMAIFAKSNDDESALEDSKDEMGSKRRLLLDRISPQCSDDEKEFFDCVIDVADSFTATTQSIRVDSDLFDSLEQLLSLRVHKSYGLLAQESINGAVLYGPPGTGKTHLARVVAKSIGTNLIVATPADIQSCWVGETEKRIKLLFSLASKLTPSIIFLDEGDALFTRRQAGDKDWTRKAMSQFLTEMDGLCKQDQPPFLLVATNRPGDMDDAVCRRLPHMLHVGMPSSEDRRAILDIYLKEEQVGDVDLDALAATGTRGFSGSDIRTLCIQAAMAAQREIDLARRKGPEENIDEAPRRVITMSHFKTALSRTRPCVTRESLLEIQKFESQQRKAR